MHTAVTIILSLILDETFGLTIIESYSVGTPVLVNNLEPFNQLVKQSVTGFTFDIFSAESLGQVLNNVKNNADNLRQNCLDEYTRLYSAQVGVKKLEQLFARIISSN